MDVMLPHETMKFGRGEPKSRIVVRMSQHHDKAIRGMVTGSEPSVHGLRANTSTLVWRKYCHRCQSQGGSRGSVCRDRHRAEGNVTAVEPSAAEHPPQRAVCVSAAPGG